MTVRIIDLNATAAGPIADLHRLCFDDGWSADAVDRILGLPGVAARLAVDPGSASAIGFVIWRNAADEAEIVALGVAPVSRRRGIAGKLIAAAESEAAAAGARQLFLEVADDNVAACALYANRGYRQVGRRSGYYRDGDGRPRDARVMMRALDADERGDVGGGERPPTPFAD
ncbi:MAG: GNAT family N-acetyltransferase [Alphaproteobacteria bacterium]|nr:GNAT family N-acetyltransferase [Alphaproteobacteria bacterium]